MVFSHSDEDLRDALNALHQSDNEDDEISERCNPNTIEEMCPHSIPVRFGAIERTNTLCSTPVSLAGSETSREMTWLQSLSKHPLITIVTGVAHIFGLGRVASSTDSKLSLSSLHSVDIDEFEEEYEISIADREGGSPGTEYGFFVSLTPQHQPGSFANRSTLTKNISNDNRAHFFLGDLPLINIFAKVLERVRSSRGSTLSIVATTPPTNTQQQQQHESQDDLHQDKSSSKPPEKAASDNDSHSHE